MTKMPTIHTYAQHMETKQESRNADRASQKYSSLDLYATNYILIQHDYRNTTLSMKTTKVFV